MTITWFRHFHENRNDLLRFGFMRLHYGGAIKYIEKPLEDAKYAGFSQKVLTYPDHRHLSFILVQNGNKRLKCLVDNEDSFALITPLITEVDLIFCAGYNADFFEKKQFVKVYSWQNENDIKWYRQTIEKKIEKYGVHFSKIRKFIPIAPNQGKAEPVSALKQRYLNLLHRLNRSIGNGHNFSNDYRGFELRHAFLKDLRNLELQYDIVLNDSLWGWPKHRINLHNKLKELQGKNYSIHSILNWTAPSECDGSIYDPVNANEFPYKTKPIDQSYEIMLSKSRLAVFACGFHWGWRNIMMLALQSGIPVLTDRLLTEPYFDINEFDIFQHDDHLWEAVESTLQQIDNAKWLEYKANNQKLYDKYMAPEAVATYFLETTSIN